MSDRSDWVSTLKGIIREMESSGVTELELQKDDLKVRLKRNPQRPSTSQPIPTEAATTPAAEGSAGYHRVAAPLTGVFYGAPNPNSPPFVSPGDWIEQGTVVALIETMKVFNEVTADCRGRLVDSLTKHGELVHSGDILFLVDTGAAPDDPAEEAS